MLYLKTFAFVWRYWRRFPLTFAILGPGLVAMILCDVLLPVFAGRLADAVALAAAQTPSRAQISAAVFALLGLVAMEATYTGLRLGLDQTWIRLAARVASELVKDTFARVQKFSTDWHANSFAGATVRDITRGMWGYDMFADTLYLGFIPSFLIIVGMTVMLAMQWPVIGVFLGLFLAAYLVISYALSVAYVGPVNRSFIQTDTRLGATLADAVSCNPIIKAFGAEARENHRLQSLADDWFDRAKRSWTREVNAGIGQRCMNLLLLVTLLGFTVWAWAHANASPGQITLVLTSFFVLSGYLRHLGMHVRNFQKSVNDMEDMIAYHGLPLGVADRPGAEPFVPGAGAIRFDRVGFKYQNQPAILFDDLSLTIRAGERVALVGHSGSGKSTLVKLTQRLYDVDSGQIRIDGQNIADIQQESLRAAIALVPQEPILFHRSLRENIAYGRPEASQAEIIKAAEKAHAHDFIAGLAEGYDTLVGERGIKLSGGERQRIAIARAFLADCAILILDEATSSLDTKTEAHIQDSIHALMEGRTTIVIAHRLSTIRQVDRILVFDRGRICEEGTHNALMAAPRSYYRELVAAQLHDGTLTPDGEPMALAAQAPGH